MDFITKWGPVEFGEGLGAVTVLVGALLTIIRLALRSGYVTRAAFVKHVAEVRALAEATKTRLDNIEAHYKTLATKEDVQKVLLAMERADGDRRVLQADVHTLKVTVDRVEDYLMNGERK